MIIANDSELISILLNLFFLFSVFTLNFRVHHFILLLFFLFINGNPRLISLLNNIHGFFNVMPSNTKLESNVFLRLSMSVKRIT